MQSQTALRFLRRWWLLLLLAPFVGGVVGYAVVRQIPAVYEANLTLLVGQGSASGTTAADELSTAGQLAQTYSEAARTRPVLEEAASRVGLTLSFRELLDRVHARRIANTQLLRISAEHTDPTTAANLANMVAQVFVSKNQEIQTTRFAGSRDNLGQLVTSLQSDLTARMQQLDQLRSQPASPERDAQLATVQAQVTQLSALHSDALRSFEDLRVVEARGMNTLTVIDPAVAPDVPIRPSPLLVTLLAVLGGLVAAVGAAALAEYVDDALRNRERVTLATGLPTLGVVPQSAMGTGLRDPATRRLAESFRLLRSNVLASVASPDGLRTLMIASPAVGEGKSTTAAHLAIALAESGRRVILIDADMHRPTQGKLFGISGRNGLSTLLLDQTASPADMLRPTWLPNLSVLPAGPTPADPSQLLSNRRLDDILEQFHKLADLVVLDTPPLLAQPDAALLGSRADAVLLVVDATRSRGRQATRAAEMLRDSGAAVLGAVLNRLPKKAMEYPTYDSYYASPPDQPAAPESGSADEAERSHVPQPSTGVAGANARFAAD